MLGSLVWGGCIIMKDILGAFFATAGHEMLYLSPVSFGFVYFSRCLSDI
jgi:hypothetical protein